MALSEQEVEKVLASVESASGRPLKYIAKKKIITDMPNNGKGEFVVMKKVGDKRFKISFFSGGKEIKKDVKGNKVGGSFPTVKGMTSHGVKVKGLVRIEQAEPAVEDTPVEVSVPVEARDIRQTPMDRIIDQEPEVVDGNEVAGSLAYATAGMVVPEYEKHLDQVFGSVGN